MATFVIGTIVFTLLSYCSEYLDENFLDSSWEDSIEYYEGNKDDLIKVYETDEEDLDYPY